MRIRWIEAMFGFGPDQTHVAVTASGRSMLHKMSSEVVGTDDLVAIYIPEGTDDVYQVGAQRGRVVGAVRLLSMPPGRAPEDFPFFDWDENERNPEWDGSARWPVGWPCRVVLEADASECPTLRSLVEVAHGKAAFGSYTAAFQRGPFKLDLAMEKALHRQFERLFGPAPWTDRA